MALIATTFDDCGFEKEFIKYLHSIGFNRPLGLQQQLLPLMVQQDYDILLSGMSKSGKTIGYILPIINQIIKDRKKNDFCISKIYPSGIILMDRKSLVESVTKQIKYICQGLNINLVMGNKKKLNFTSVHGVDIIIAKVEIMRDYITNFGSGISNIKYIIVDQANLYSKGNSKIALKKIYDYVQQFGNTEVISVFSSMDFRNEENNLLYNFFGDNVRIIKNCETRIVGNNLRNNSLLHSNNLQFSNSCNFNKANNGNHVVNNKDIINSITKEYIVIHVFDPFKSILQVVNQIFKKDPLVNIVIFTKTSHIGKYLNYLLCQTYNKVLFIDKSSNCNHSNLNITLLIQTILIIGDDSQFNVNYKYNNIILVHLHVPSSKIIYEKNISMFKSNFNQVIKSILLDSEEKLDDFIKCIC
ncbi:DNA/RNA helicase, DEAD/DEAH box type, N-terminal domain and Helicase, superfamily 1/2, ATP-binding domain and RNA helicase, DEAD-box type, Q motif domain and P-loop containing nucleoside triphosphate hydrolase domain-containing protein [Strongyloides ratti]|uniref:ATP-dependent RNA helicase n=1 Tax=Strongyloides ratti TaxID=34506 RepID=A0A090LDN1_STRRB|nr:DNA/RNA helicase, DEAD/DEAH box type, N-terminal domain and Helicase, superfamily 1/2, ATP-binding domain and RNA helicase, DEAD-box type, Q motif domain and P-loop containing nucleoside triphosphate hydrolase domain-containing protein [Strongyloides ratti]CEF67911.1 DNA/RNA helicase, DEAD/DEAH box type, N-terminal domain and Helicase, superfamily 1/2, ATP-binding domain and RNA helicase, DEAD-box type, Q motif domain and P-loop containing nucleoside triphosphate hydrolase domain-containing pro